MHIHTCKPLTSKPHRIIIPQMLRKSIYISSHHIEILLKTVTLTPNFAKLFTTRVQRSRSQTSALNPSP